MDKLAQQRGIFDKLREKANITGKILESINPEFQEMMDRLRSTDEKIREHAVQLKDLARSSKSYLNRRDYLSSAVNMSAFHERCRYIAAELQKFISGVDMKHYKFLLDQFDDEQKEMLFGYDPSKEIKLNDVSSVNDKVITASLKKKAGVSDWWFKVTDPIADLAHNLTSEKSQAMRALEKRFSISFLKNLKADTASMVDKTNSFLQFLLGMFKKLSVALAKRNVDQYVEISKSFISKFSMYHNLFVKYYEKDIVPLKRQHEQIIEDLRTAEEAKSLQMEQEAKLQREREQQAKEWKEKGMQQRVEEKFTPATPVSAPSPQPPSKEEAEAALSKLKQLQEDDDEKTRSLSKTEKRSNRDFLSRIEKISNLKQLVSEIILYSEKLENSHPKDSLKLLAIAEGIIEDYKTAAKKKEEKDPLA